MTVHFRTARPRIGDIVARLIDRHAGRGVPGGARLPQPVADGLTRLSEADMANPGRHAVGNALARLSESQASEAERILSAVRRSVPSGTGSDRA